MGPKKYGGLKLKPFIFSMEKKCVQRSLRSTLSRSSGKFGGGGGGVLIIFVNIYIYMLKKVGNKNTNLPLGVLEKECSLQ